MYFTKREKVELSQAMGSINRHKSLTRLHEEGLKLPVTDNAGKLLRKNKTGFGVAVEEWVNKWMEGVDWLREG